MKHIKQFNESIEDGLDKDYLDMIFVNFLDRGMQSSIRNAKFTSTISADEYKLQINYDFVSNIDTMESYGEQVKQDSLELKECMAKVRIEYPNAKYSLFMANQNFTLKVWKESIGIIDVIGK